MVQTPLIPNGGAADLYSANHFNSLPHHPRIPPTFTRLPSNRQLRRSFHESSLNYNNGNNHHNQQPPQQHMAPPPPQPPQHHHQQQQHHNSAPQQAPMQNPDQWNNGGSYGGGGPSGYDMQPQQQQHQQAMVQPQYNSMNNTGYDQQGYQDYR